jgi:hypothetical protein
MDKTHAICKECVAQHYWHHDDDEKYFFKVIRGATNEVVRSYIHFFSSVHRYYLLVSQFYPFPFFKKNVLSFWSGKMDNLR